MTTASGIPKIDVQSTLILELEDGKNPMQLHVINLLTAAKHYLKIKFLMIMITVHIQAPSHNVMPRVTFSVMSLGHAYQKVIDFL